MNISGKYLKVWKVDEQPNYKKVDLGEGEKKYNGEGYDNWCWYSCFLAGNARNVAIKEGDKVEVKSGKIKMQKYQDKWSPSVTIFDIEVMQSNVPSDVAQGVSNASYSNSDASIPF